MIEPTVFDYRPSADLDADIAALVLASVRGWPDQGAVTAPLVRSALQATGTRATTLALHRDQAGGLDAFAAIRWPATLEAVGRLWGPMVHPAAQGAGLARAMLDAVTQVVAAQPGVRIQTAPIPESRTKGWALFESAGWQGSGTSSLLKRALPVGQPQAQSCPGPVAVRAARQGEYLDQMLAALFAAARPDTGYATARDTFQRWASDARYVPGGLLLAERESGLTGVAMLYPPAHRSRPGPTSREFFYRPADETRDGAPDPPREALLADLITAPDLDDATAEAVRAALVSAAIGAGAEAGAEVARAESGCPFLIATLKAAGFQVADQFRFYMPPLPLA